MITGAQVEAARKLLNWSQISLAEAAGLGLEIIIDVELGRNVIAVEEIAFIRAALERDGITFIGSNGVEFMRRTGDQPD